MSEPPDPLARMESRLAAGAPAVHLTGPRGAGKSALLAELERRAAGRARVVRLAPSPATAAGVCERTLAHLGLTSRGDPLAALRAAAAETGDTALTLVLVDDADALPGCETARLRDLAEASRGRLRFVLAARSEPLPTARTLVGVDPANEVALGGPASEPPAPGPPAPAATRSLPVPGAAQAPRARASAPTATRRRPAPLRPSATARRAGRRLAVAAAVLAMLGAAGLLARVPVRRLPELLGGADAAQRAPAVATPLRTAQTPARPTPPPSPPAPPVRVGINASPWARIELDGRPLGETPLGDVAVPAGVHHFRARMSDGRVLERRVEIGPDRRHVVFR